MVSFVALSHLPSSRPFTAEGSVTRYLGFGKHAKRSSYSRSFVGLAPSSKMTGGKENTVFLERSEGTLSNCPRPCENKSPWATTNVNTVIQRRVENPTSGTVTCYLDQCETRKPWFTFQIITSHCVLLMMTTGGQGPPLR